jgi:hypothetical protein
MSHPAIRRRTLIWLALVSVHATAGAYAWLVGGDRIAAIVAGSIYLPLLPLEKLGLPVVQSTGWFFPPPTALGWLFVAAFWVVLHWYLAALIARCVRGCGRAA